MWVLVSEGVGYHNQSKHFLYTPNPGPPKNHTYSTGLLYLDTQSVYFRTSFIL